MLDEEVPDRLRDMSCLLVGVQDPIPASVMNSVQRLRINEIFHSIQGESSFAGRRCVLVRLTGCQMRCTWCDTQYSFYEGGWMSLEEIEAEVGRYDCPLVELTGGEPLLQPAALPLMERLCDAGWEVLLETGGGLDMRAVKPALLVKVDPVHFYELRWISYLMAQASLAYVGDDVIRPSLLEGSDAGIVRAIAAMHWPSFLAFVRKHAGGGRRSAKRCRSGQHPGVGLAQKGRIAVVR